MLIFTGYVNLHLKQERKLVKKCPGVVTVFTARALKEIGEPHIARTEKHLTVLESLRLVLALPGLPVSICIFFWLMFRDLQLRHF